MGIEIQGGVYGVGRYKREELDSRRGSRMRVKKYNKIVRDKVPEIIMGNGGICKTKIVDNKTAIKMLIKKIHEEADELERFIGKNSAINELADMAEVLSFLVVKMGWDWNQVETVRQLKLAERGGFATNTVLIEASKV